MTDHILPCGCRLDATFVCDEHRREGVARFVAGEAVRLVTLALFVAVVAVWAAILGGP